MTQKTVAVTGASGYVGSVLCRHLRHSYRTLEFVRTPVKKEQSSFSLEHPPSPDAFDGVSALVHCAWDMATVNKGTARARNVCGSIAVCRAAKEAGVETILFVSSISAHAGCRSQYGKTKLEVEKAVSDMGGTVLRPGLVYGEIDAAGGMIRGLDRLARALPAIPVVHPEAMLYMAHEEDLATLVLALLQSHHTPAEPITAACPAPITFSEVLRHLASRHGRSPWIIKVPWRSLYLPILLGERVGVRIGFKSDSLLSLVYGHEPDFRPLAYTGVHFRPPFALPESTKRAANME
jgi:nucleoside-diphosphate-sugar epimerase